MSDQKTAPIPNSREADLAGEMSRSFVDYAMSVITSRALPDVRDGLKPVQRRIIYSMQRANLSPTGRHRKCATVVGDVMGRFHPHGDQAIYDAMVRLGQNFSLGHPLVDPQGNFGSVEDPPAQMRYTECRLSKIAAFMLDGIDEDTVDYADNYDGEHREPTVLPALFPNLLVNGAQGIAVGMATNIPPHNLAETVEAAVHLLDNPGCDASELLEYMLGPDFPTGGRILENEAVERALLTGRGSIKLRAVAEPREIRPGRNAIVVTELPYQISQDRVLEKIAELVNRRQIQGIADLRDESSARVGTRVVIELRNNATPGVVLNQLYKQTPLQTTIGVNMVALVDGVPRVVGIKEALGRYLEHQTEVLQRRYRHRLEKARAREHILEGMEVAVENIGAVIEAIRASADTPSARGRLMEVFELSEIQANAILEMPLRRLTALEIENIATELGQLRERIDELEGVLANPGRQRTIIRRKLREAKAKFGGPRRSLLIPDTGDMAIEDLIDDEELLVTVSRGGYVKSVSAEAYRTQGRGGRGVRAARLKEGDVISHLLRTSAHSYLLLFTNRGMVHRLRALELPRQSRTGKGTLAHAVLPLDPDERIEAIIDTGQGAQRAKHLVFFTRHGIIKKTELEEYDSPNRTLRAINLQEGDELVAVRPTSGEDDLLIFTERGRGLRFSETEARAMGRATRGVIGIRLAAGDQVVGACSDRDGDQVLLVTSRGYAKRTKTRLFLPRGEASSRSRHRGGQGIMAFKLTRHKGTLVGARAVAPDDQVMLVSTGGNVIRTTVASVSVQARAATGVRVMKIEGDETLSAFEVSAPDKNGERD